MKGIQLYTPHLGWDYKDSDESTIRIFLGGTIDNGDSIDWQKAIINEIANEEHDKKVIIYNPRREMWNASPSDSSGLLKNQIEWELFHLEKADLIVMNILGNSKSPISLMEIGLFARQNKLMIFCPQKFYRYKNIQVVCEKYNIPLFDTNDILVLKNQILKKTQKQ